MGTSISVFSFGIIALFLVGLSVSTRDYNPNGTFATETVSSLTDGALSTASFVYELGPCARAAGNSATQFFCIPVE